MAVGDFNHPSEKTASETIPIGLPYRVMQSGLTRSPRRLNLLSRSEHAAERTAEPALRLSVRLLTAF